MKDIIMKDIAKNLEGIRYKKCVKLNEKEFIVEIDEAFIHIDGEMYWREGKNIIEQVKNAVLQHENWAINSNELEALNKWDGIIK